MKSTVALLRQGILLVGHGTRDAEGVAEFLAIARQVAQARPEFAVEACFLEISDPPIATGVARLAERGVEQIIVMPLLLFAAGHAKHDVPETVAAALTSFSQIAWTQAGHLGCHPAIVEQSAARFREAIHGRPAVPRERTALVIVGRGSRDDEATCEMHHFASLVPHSASVGSVEVCFAAMARPSLDETLKHIAARQYQRVIVQPHLLFGGLLLAGIRDAVATWTLKHPATEWLVAGHLGPTPLVVEAILERVAYADAFNPHADAGAQVPAATILR